MKNQSRYKQGDHPPPTTHAHHAQDMFADAYMDTEPVTPPHTPKREPEAPADKSDTMATETDVEKRLSVKGVVDLLEMLTASAMYVLHNIIHMCACVFVEQHSSQNRTPARPSPAVVCCVYSVCSHQINGALA